MRLLRLAALLTAAVVLAGCGGSGGSGGNGVAEKSADEIVAEATTAAKGATSVHVHGGGATNDGSALEIDMHLVAGEGGEGHLVVNGLSFDIVRIGDKAYFKGDDDFWRQFGGEAAVQLLHDRWLVAPSTTGDLASFTPLTDIEQLFEELLTGQGELEKGEETTVDGESAIAVEDTSDGGTLYVATEGEPYPLKVEKTGDDAGAISFDEWNESYELTTPSDAIDIAQLQS